jgi:hypothetical protein
MGERSAVAVRRGIDMTKRYNIVLLSRVHFVRKPTLLIAINDYDLTSAMTKLGLSD